MTILYHYSTNKETINKIYILFYTNGSKVDLYYCLAATH